MKVHIQLSYGFDATKTALKFNAGHAPDKVDYGFHHAEHIPGYIVSYSKGSVESSLKSKIRMFLFELVGFDFLHAYGNKDSIYDADVVWTMSEYEYLAVLALQYFFAKDRRAKVICQNIWLFNLNTYTKILNKRDFYNFIKNYLRRTLASYLIPAADVLTIHSIEYLEPIKKKFPKVKVRLLRFGISGDAFPISLIKHSKKPSQIIRIFSAGNDFSRDWQTLFSAFGNDPRFHLNVVCHHLQNLEEQYNNVCQINSPSIAYSRKLYAECDIVIISMHPNQYAGITVALEAVACGALLICSRTGGVPTYFAEDEVIFVPPHDINALRNAALISKETEFQHFIVKAQRRFLEEDYTTKGMIGRYASLTQELIEGNL